MTSKDISEKFYGKPLFVNLLLLGINLFLFLFKLIVSSLSGSLALQADAFDNLTDIIMVFAAIVGIYYAKKKPNKKFPYGYYKIENIISLIISMVIFFTAYNIIVSSFSQISETIAGAPKQIIVTPTIFLFLIISLLISFLSTIYLKVVGKQTKSPIIQSQATEKLYDNLISSSVIIGFISALFGVNLVDSIISLIIALLIIKGGYDIFLTSTKTLLDAVIDFDKRNELYKIIDRFPNVKEIENIEIRSYGRYIFLEVVIELNKELHLHQVELLKDSISVKIKAEFPEIFKIIIISQAQPKEIIKIVVPITEDKGLNSKISGHFGESPFFFMMELQEKNNQFKLINHSIVPNKFKDEEKRKGILISEWFLEEKIDKLYLKSELKKGPKLILESSLVQMIITKFESLQEIIEQETQI
ncbi:MAG: cation diffusion facilitator family transporter [Promethearchaeota archaeon]